MPSNLNGTVYTIGIGGLNSLPPAPSQAAFISVMQGAIPFIEAQGPAVCKAYVEPVTYTPVSNLCQNTTTLGAVRVVGTPASQILRRRLGAGNPITLYAITISLICNGSTCRVTPASLMMAEISSMKSSFTNLRQGSNVGAAQENDYRSRALPRERFHQLRGFPPRFALSGGNRRK